MDITELEKRRFPLGKYNPGENITPKDVETWMLQIKSLPSELGALTSSLTTADLERTYRPGSWTIRQVVHHIADSHINAYGRMKRTLTEDIPTILPYNEKEWAQLDDVQRIPISTSISILEGVHARLYAAIKELSIEQLARMFQHKEMEKPHNLAYLIGMYAWHGKHHLAHIKLAMQEDYCRSKCKNLPFS